MERYIIKAKKKKDIVNYISLYVPKNTYMLLEECTISNESVGSEPGEATNSKQPFNLHSFAT